MGIPREAEKFPVRVKIRAEKGRIKETRGKNCVFQDKIRAVPVPTQLSKRKTVSPYSATK